MKRDKLQRISEKMDKELKEIQDARMQSIDNKFPRKISKERLTEGIVRCEEWKGIKKKLLREPRKEDLR